MNDKGRSSEGLAGVSAVITFLAMLLLVLLAVASFLALRDGILSRFLARGVSDVPSIRLPEFSVHGAVTVALVIGGGLLLLLLLCCCCGCRRRGSVGLVAVLLKPILDALGAAAQALELAAAATQTISSTLGNTKASVDTASQNLGNATIPTVTPQTAHLGAPFNLDVVTGLQFGTAPLPGVSLVTTALGGVAADIATVKTQAETVHTQLLGAAAALRSIRDTLAALPV